MVAWDIPLLTPPPPMPPPSSITQVVRARALAEVVSYEKNDTFALGVVLFSLCAKCPPPPPHFSPPRHGFSVFQEGGKCLF